MGNKIRGSVVVITGASSGIGRAAAMAFAQRGASVVLAARNGEGLEHVADACRQFGARALAAPTDMCDESAVKELARKAIDEFGKIDVWVNNAAVSAFGRFEEVPSDVFRKVIEANLFGYVNGARAAIPHFRERASGVLINVSSVLGTIGAPYLSAYTASKYAIMGLSESLRIENVHENVHVCTVLPASIDTPIFQHAANYTGRAIKPLNPVYDANRVAEAIVACARRPKPQVSVGAAGHGLRAVHGLSLRLYDRLMFKQVNTDHFQERSAPPSRGNVDRPMPEWDRVSGDWPHTGERPGTTLKTVLGVLVPTAAVVGMLILVGGKPAEQPRTRRKPARAEKGWAPALADTAWRTAHELIESRDGREHRDEPREEPRKERPSGWAYC